MPGFFGDQAMRLLREAWGSLKVEGRKESGAKDLAEELYSMLQAEQPMTSSVPVQITPATTVPALEINNNVGGTSIAVNGGDVSFGGGGDFTVDGGTLNLGGTNTTIAGNTITFNAGGLTLQFGDGGTPGEPGTGGGAPGTPSNPVDFTTLINDLIDEALGDQQQAPGTPTTVVMGQVIGGSGREYQVALYGNGPGQDATETVTAIVPQIANGETIPPGTWIAAVHKFTFTPTNSFIQRTQYAFQPPVWL